MHTDRFTPLDAATLLRWMQHDLPNKQLFGIDRELFFMPKPDDPFRMERYGKVLETPLGVAAGPHTQLAQNILSAWLFGARYIELKTVQVLDELNVALSCGMVTQENAEKLIDAALAFGDVVSTGRNAPEWLRARADYVSEIAAQKHPFETEKLAAREGIEY